MSHLEIAEALFAGFASGDADAVRALCAPDMTATQNHGPAMSVDTLLEFTLAVLKVVKGFRYEEAVRTATDRGFVEEHQVRGTLPDGSQLDLAACVVGEVSDGRITALREYLDGSKARPLLKALGQ